MSAMGLEAVDLVVIPWPSEPPEHRALSDRGERQRDGALFLKTWKALQRVVDAGVIHAIGRSVGQSVDNLALLHYTACYK